MASYAWDSWAYYRLNANSTIGDFEELVSTFPNITPDDVNQSPTATAFAGGHPFETWAIYFPTQDLADQYLVTDESTGKALPWYATGQYKNNVDELQPSTVTAAGQIDVFNRVGDGSARRMPTPQDLQDGKTGYDIFTRYAKLKAGATTDISHLMYDNRDKRFAASIVYDRNKWIGETLETNLGGNAAQGVRDKEDGGWYNTVTGYYWKKNTPQDITRSFYANNTAMHYCLARVGEAYLNLAEAYLLKGDVAKAVAAFNHTRTTHGGLAASTATTSDEAWADYIRERRVEMACEGGDIYFSYLRWGKYGHAANANRNPGDIIYDLDRPVYKIEINRDRSALLVGQLTLLGSANRNFTVRRYLFPIAQSFLDTREAYGLDHTQNEGW